jgi:hypothetical protein
MTLAEIGSYIAGSGIMGAVFVCAGAAVRILWDMRRER